MPGIRRPVKVEMAPWRAKKASVLCNSSGRAKNHRPYRGFQGHQDEDPAIAPAVDGGQDPVDELVQHAWGSCGFLGAV
jgi:hypothetical protein